MQEFDNLHVNASLLSVLKLSLTTFPMLSMVSNLMLPILVEKKGDIFPIPFSQIVSVALAVASEMSIRMTLLHMVTLS